MFLDGEEESQFRDVRDVIRLSWVLYVIVVTLLYLENDPEDLFTGLYKRGLWTSTLLHSHLNTSVALGFPSLRLLFRFYFHRSQYCMYLSPVLPSLHFCSSGGPGLVVYLLFKGKTDSINPILTKTAHDFFRRTDYSVLYRFFFWCPVLLWSVYKRQKVKFKGSYTSDKCTGSFHSVIVDSSPRKVKQSRKTSSVDKSLVL